MPPRKSPPSRVATAVSTPVCRSTSVAPQKTIENSMAITATRKTQASQNRVGSGAPSLVPEARTRRGPARRSSPTMTSRPSAGTSPSPHGRPAPGGDRQDDRADEGRDHRPDVGAGDTQTRQASTRATEQRIGVAQERSGPQTDQQRRPERRRERRPEGEDDNGDGKRWRSRHRGP